MAGLAPFGAEGLDWFAGMTDSGVASLRAAAEGRAAKESHKASAEYDPEMFTPADHAALAGERSWFGDIVGPAVEAGPGGLIDDDLAYLTPWGFHPAQVSARSCSCTADRTVSSPVRTANGSQAAAPRRGLRLNPADGHLSVLNAGAAALAWLVDHSDDR